MTSASPSTPIARLALVGVCLAAMAACAPKPAVQPAVPNDPTPSGPAYPGPGTGSGNVGGSPIGAARPGSEQDFVMNVGDRIYFDLDSYQINADAYPRLNAQAAWLQRYPQITIRIEGNADERGTREYNLALGARRANAVKEYLVSQGVSTGRVETVSYGKERPVCTTSDEGCWSQNRRGVTIVTGGANS